MGEENDLLVCAPQNSIQFWPSKNSYSARAHPVAASELASNSLPMAKLEERGKAESESRFQLTQILQAARRLLRISSRLDRISLSISKSAACSSMDSFGRQRRQFGYFIVSLSKRARSQERKSYYRPFSG